MVLDKNDIIFLDDSFKQCIEMVEKKDKVAQCFLGISYINGIYVKQNFKKAEYWLTKSIKQGFCDAFYQLACLYMYNEAFKNKRGKGFDLLKKSTESGYAKSQRLMGDLYHSQDNQYVKHDDKMALSLYKKAAEQNDVDSQFNLFIFYMHGFATHPDYEQAYYWVKRAAENNDVEAMCNLAICYKNGDGIKRNLKESFKWLKKAADNELPKAQKLLGDFYKNGTGTKRDKEKSFYYYKKAAENECVEAYNILSMMYYNGDGTNKDRDAALIWAKKGADLNDERSLAVYYYILEH